MNTINRTALSNLRQNKGRNIMAGIAIFLTTILVFVIPVIGLGAVDLEIAAANKIANNFLFMFFSFLLPSLTNFALPVLHIFQVLQRPFFYF